MCCKSLKYISAMIRACGSDQGPRIVATFPTSDIFDSFKELSLISDVSLHHGIIVLYMIILPMLPIFTLECTLCLPQNLIAVSRHVLHFTLFFPDFERTFQLEPCLMDSVWYFHCKSAWFLYWFRVHIHFCSFYKKIGVKLTF